jgi:hypothetical protein
MIEIAVGSWHVWTPAVEPDVSFVPPLLRRRCTRLTKMMLHAALGIGAAPAELASLPAVFASRHGDIQSTVALLETLARRQPITASAFSHSVHNAQVGLFSIAMGNRGLASAVAGGPDTFGSAFLEATGTMVRGGGDKVLLVVADEELPEMFRRGGEPASVAYAVAMLLGQSGIWMRFEPGVGEPASRSETPDALRFVEWLSAASPSLTLGSRTPYTWTR